MIHQENSGNPDPVLKIGSSQLPTHVDECKKYTTSGTSLPFGISYGHLAYFVAILVFFPRFGMLYEEKSGNPDPLAKNGLYVLTRLYLYIF
jgi:hypothetical protein